MKVLLDKDLGSNGNVKLQLDKAKLQLVAEYNLLQLVDGPIKAALQKAKDAIPGKIDDAIIDKIYEEIKKELEQ